MAISGYLKVSAILGSNHTQFGGCSLLHSKVDLSCFPSGRSRTNEATPKCRSISNQIVGSTRNYEISTNSFDHETENFLLNAINMSFFERLNLAWKILFPSPTTKRNSNAMIAKQRLKMILFSDRCAVSDEAKQKIVKNIVQALSDFVEIESQDKVQLSVSTDTQIGTIYSVTVPVRRVKQEYLEGEEESGTITNIEYKDTGEMSGSVDVRFDFFVPDENGL